MADRPQRYSELLRDPRWQKKRLEILQRDDWACRLCGDSESTLHVHHLLYERGCAPWEYGAHRLLTVCELCHQALHDSEHVRHELAATLIAAGFSIEDLLSLDGLLEARLDGVRLTREQIEAFFAAIENATRFEGKA